MTTPTNLFPVVTPKGQTPWWVVWNAAGNGSVQIVQEPQEPASPAVGKVFGPYATRAEAQAVATAETGLGGLINAAGLGANAGLGVATGGALGDVTQGSGDCKKPGGANPLSWTSYLACVLTQRGTWIRVLEIGIGGVLIIIGIVKLAEPAAKEFNKAVGAIPK